MDGSKPYDASINGLIGLQPEAWVQFFARLVGIPYGPFDEIDTDLSITAQSDKVFRINGTVPTLLHLEFESSHRLGIPRDLMRYNVLIGHRHELPVESVLVLLHRRAQTTDLTGVYQRVGAGPHAIHEFRYRVERVWEQPADYWLNAGLGLAPLAVLTDEASTGLENVLLRLKDRVATSTPVIREGVYNATSFLSGLRYDSSEVFPLLRRLNMLMKESTVYQAIQNEGIEIGRQDGLQNQREMIVELGTQRFGPPSRVTVEQLQVIVDMNRFKELTKRILTATNWDELLATTTTSHQT